MKTLSSKPKKTIFTTAKVESVLPSRVSKSERYMVTEFKLSLNGPASGEARNGVNVYLTWNPAWFRPGFDIVALSAEVSKLQALAESGDENAAAEAKGLNAQLYVASQNIFANENEEFCTLRGLVGGKSWDEHKELWSQVANTFDELGLANPGSEEDEQEELRAQKAIVDGVDKFFESFFGNDGPGGKYLALTYGHKQEDELDKDGNFILDANNRRVKVPSKYRNVLKFELPTVKKLKSWRDSCKKATAKTVNMVDEADPFGDQTTPF